MALRIENPFLSVTQPDPWIPFHLKRAHPIASVGVPRRADGVFIPDWVGFLAFLVGKKPVVNIRPLEDGPPDLMADVLIYGQPGIFPSRCDNRIDYIN